MQVLFLHPNFPAQFRNLAVAIGSDPTNQVIFGTKNETVTFGNINKVIYQENGTVNPKTHRYVQILESAVWQGQAVYRMAAALKNQGFNPDIVLAHSGWGPGMFIKDIFPDTKYLCYFEWFYNAYGTDADFDPEDPLNEDTAAKMRVNNTPLLLDLCSCDRGICPTNWQHQQFPKEFQPKIQVLHDGIDTAYFKPNPNAQLILPRINLDLSSVSEIITYVARGMEPYRGFPQFMKAVSLIQQRRPNCHVVVVGEDRVAYGKELPNEKTYKQLMLETLSLDLTRLHFTGLLPYGEYLKVLQASSVHIYLTYPFVLSWSMLEAMSTGCLVIASATPPVLEVITDGENGLLVDFFSPQQIAERVDEVFADKEKMPEIRYQARKTILKNYDLNPLLYKHLEWMVR